MKDYCFGLIVGAALFAFAFIGAFLITEEVIKHEQPVRTFSPGDKVKIAGYGETYTVVCADGSWHQLLAPTKGNPFLAPTDKLNKVIEHKAEIPDPPPPSDAPVIIRIPTDVFPPPPSIPPPPDPTNLFHPDKRKDKTT